MLKVQTTKGEVAFTFAHYRGLVGVVVSEKAITDVTHCRLQIGNKGYSGVSLCGSSDNFDKDKGRKLALFRVLQNAKLDRKLRTEVWKRYHARRQSNVEYANSHHGNSAPDVHSESPKSTELVTVN